MCVSVFCIHLCFLWKLRDAVGLFLKSHPFCFSLLFETQAEAEKKVCRDYLYRLKIKTFDLSNRRAKQIAKISF